MPSVDSNLNIKLQEEQQQIEPPLDETHPNKRTNAIACVGQSEKSQSLRQQNRSMDDNETTEKPAVLPAPPKRPPRLIDHTKKRRNDATSASADDIFQEKIKEPGPEITKKKAFLVRQHELKRPPLARNFACRSISEPNLDFL